MAFMDGLLAARRVKKANVLRMAFWASTKFKRNPWEYCVFFVGVFPHVWEFVFFLFPFLGFLMGVEPILGNFLGLVWESVGNPLDCAWSVFGTYP